MNLPTIEWLPLPCWIADQEGRCLWINDALRDLVGDGDRASWLDWLHPDDRMNVIPALADARAGQRPVEAVIRLKSASGAYKWAVLRGYPLAASQQANAEAMPSPAGSSISPTIYGFIAVDISGQQSLVAALHDEELRGLMASLEERVGERTRELQRINEELDQFAYVASHDLRAPLRAIDHLATWITEDAGELLPPRSREHLSKMRGRIARMERLLEDLLTYSRAGRQRGIPARIRMPDLVARVVDVLSPPDDFSVAVSGDTLPIYTLAVPLETVLRNLIGNAIKHHDRSDGRVVVHTERMGEWLRISVRDDGPGINPAFHERIFQMFQTLRPRDEVEGSGIGLSVVKKIIENMGGRIELESTPGQGSTFIFTWPLEPDPDVSLTNSSVDKQATAQTP